MSDTHNGTVTEDKMGNITITYGDGRTVYLQTDFEKANFGVNCGMIKAPRNWNGIASELPDNWWEIDWESIRKIPEYYRDFAE